MSYPDDFKKMIIIIYDPKLEITRFRETDTFKNLRLSVRADIIEAFKREYFSEGNYFSQEIKRQRK